MCVERQSTSEDSKGISGRLSVFSGPARGQDANFDGSGFPRTVVKCCRQIYFPVASQLGNRVIVDSADCWTGQAVGVVA